jgi:hypothetical protein
VRIDVQPTPNVHALKFALDRRVTEGKSQTYTSAEQTTQAPLAGKLLSVPGVRMVFLLNDFITLTRDPTYEWNAIAPEAERIIREHYEAEGE